MLLTTSFSAYQTLDVTVQWPPMTWRAIILRGPAAFSVFSPPGSSMPVIGAASPSPRYGLPAVNRHIIHMHFKPLILGSSGIL